MSIYRLTFVAIGGGLLAAVAGCTQSASPVSSRAAAAPEVTGESAVLEATVAAAQQATNRSDASAHAVDGTAPETLDAATVLNAAIQRADTEKKLLLVHIGAPG